MSGESFDASLKERVAQGIKNIKKAAFTGSFFGYI
jgi:hypothetical protein